MLNQNSAALCLPLFIEGKQTASQSAGTADRVSASRWGEGLQWRTQLSLQTLLNVPHRGTATEPTGENGGRDSHT